MPTDIALQLVTREAVPHSADLQTIWVALIAGGSAILGATLGGLVTFITTKITVRSQAELERQRIKATLISTERLRWLQDIRVRLSNVYAKMDMQFNLLQRTVIAEQHASHQQQLDDLSNEIMIEANVIHLMLNPEKPQQKVLRDSLQKAQLFLLNHFNQQALASSESSRLAYREIKQVAFDALTTIGLETWRRIKQIQ